MDLLCGTTSGKPYIGFSKLPHGYYEVFKFRFVRNKNYRPEAKDPGLPRIILVELNDQVLFLPQYFARDFNDDDEKLDKLNTDGIKKYLYFGGKREENQ